MHIFKAYTAQGIAVRLILAGSSCISGWVESDEHGLNIKFRFSGQNNIVPMYSEQKGVVESLSNSSDNVFFMVDWEILKYKCRYLLYYQFNEIISKAPDPVMKLTYDPI